MNKFKRIGLLCCLVFLVIALVSLLLMFDVDPLGIHSLKHEVSVKFLMLILGSISLIGALLSYAGHLMNDQKGEITKLEQALHLLGYKKAKHLHQKHVLVSAISSFASVTNNEDLEAACNAELDRLKAEIQASQNQ